MIKPEELEFPPLNCSLDRQLGDYYQDFSAAIPMVESGYHGGFDDRGVPLLTVPGQGAFANAVTTAQYALANMTAVRRGAADRADRARVQLDWLVREQEQEGEWRGCWLMRHDNQKYPWLHAPWTGSLASGHAISALLRGWELFDVDAYATAAEAAYRGLNRQRATDRLYLEADGTVWYEEYPASPPLHVLNGHIYTVLAVVDYARATCDSEADARWRHGMSTALDQLQGFDLGYWSAYDLRWREPTSVHYHKNIHIPQLRIVTALTGDPRADAVADRWERYLASRACRARWAVALRLRRFKKR